ncbi:hypothetical protein N7451_006768 [Penicillium sp. IBT 35674x]|nr:hypothetical protein N7451_006768 [Penicillium sp. IBT 35674x]
MFFRNSGGTVNLSSKDSANTGILPVESIQDVDHFQISELPNMDELEDETRFSAIPSTGIGETIAPFWGDMVEVQTLRDDIDWLFEPLQDIPKSSEPGPSECDISLPNFDFPTIWHAEAIPEDDIDETVHRSPADIAEWSLAHSSLLMALDQLGMNILQSPFFEVENLKMFHDLYFHHYHPHFPIFHRPTLIISEIEPLLLITLLTLGSTMAEDSNLYELGQSVHDSLRLIIISSGSFSPPIPLWCLQALLMIQAHGKMKSSRKNYEMAHVFHGSILTMMKRGSIYPATSTFRARSQISDLRHEWRQWVDEESWRRSAFFAFCMDAQHACLFGHTPILSVSDMRMALPCKESLWESTSPESWYQLIHSEGKTQPAQFLPTLKKLLQEAIAPAVFSEYSRFVLLHGLISLQSHLQSMSRLTLGIERGNTNDSKSRPGSTLGDPRRLTPHSTPPWANMISLAITAWSDCLLSLQPSLCLEAARPLHRIAQITLHVNMIDLLTLAMDPDHLGSAHARSSYDKARARILEWCTTESAREAVRYSLLLVQETMFSGHMYRARDDNIAPRPWCLYMATLTLWMYGVMTEGSPQLNETDQRSAEEYLIRMTRALKGILPAPVGANQTSGLIHAVRDALEDCRWELLQDAHRVLGRLCGGQSI